MHVFCLLRDAELSRKISTMDWKHPRNSNEEEFQKLLYSMCLLTLSGRLSECRK